MNWKLLQGLLGRLFIAYGLVMIAPIMTAVYYREYTVRGFAPTAAVLVLLGLTMLKKGSRIQERFSPREGLVIVALIWLTTSLFGACAFYLTGYFPSFIDAFFESVSGLTTTGASVLPDLETMPRSIVFWRSISHWLGGMGIIVLFIIFLPNIGMGAVHLFNTEVPGPLAEKVMPKIKDTARTLWLIYSAMTVLCALLLLLAGMPIFEALNHALALVSGGGFSTRTAGVSSFHSLAVELIFVIFMFLNAINFNLYIHAWRHRSLLSFNDPEFKLYGAIIAFAFCFVTLSLVIQQQMEFFTAVRQSLFQVVAMSTTTGYATVDYNQWPAFAQFVLFVLMFAGGCSRSTAGGIKIVRVLVLFKLAWTQMKQAIHPRLVVNILIRDKVVDYNILAKVGGFVFLYFIVFFVASLLLTITGLEIFDAMAAAIASLSNVGIGFGLSGPMANYASIAPFGKLVLTICMLIGRLEVLPFLVFLQPAFWKPIKKW
ncbi:MAG: TrkH family potassium uptake protein [Peptococcaceae bacterium]|nr:TrkH family potassium uptake protein [Peptococcaceae bacterium]